MTSTNPSNLELQDAGETLRSLVLQPAEPRAVVLFAVGAGGDPDRHIPLLQALSDQGRTVVAPRFARLVSPAPSAAEIAMRARRLQLAFDHVAKSNLPAVGVGHSIGAAMLLMLAGAEATTLAGDIVLVSPDRRLDKLA